MDVFLLDFLVSSSYILGDHVIINFHNWIQNESLDFYVKVIFRCKILVEKEERNLGTCLLLDFESIVSNITKIDMSVCLELNIAPLNELFPDQIKPFLVEFFLSFYDPIDCKNIWLSQLHMKA